MCCLCTQTAACLSLPATLNSIVVPQNSHKTVLVASVIKFGAPPFFAPPPPTLPHPPGTIGPLSALFYWEDRAPSVRIAPLFIVSKTVASTRCHHLKTCTTVHYYWQLQGTRCFTFITVWLNNNNYFRYAAIIMNYNLLLCIPNSIMQI